MTPKIAECPVIISGISRDLTARTAPADRYITYS